MRSAVILAAGLSSRMRDFKPLLPFGGKTVIETAIARLWEGGAEKIIVVTGFLGAEMETHLHGTRIQCVHNANYAHQQMLDSVKLGLQYATGDEIYLLPGDLPQFAPSLLDALAEASGDAAFPVCRGKNGHPLLLRPSAVETVRKYHGERGLKGALDHIRSSAVPTEDEGCLMDIDTWEDYQKLLAFRADSVPTGRECEELFQLFGTTPQILAHCHAVERVASKLSSGIPRIDSHLLQIACRIHDAARSRKNHADVLADELERRGYLKIASVVRTHMDLPAMMHGSISENSLLFLADKLVQGDREVTLEERFRTAEEKYGDQDGIRASIQRKKEYAQEIYELVRHSHESIRI